MVSLGVVGRSVPSGFDGGALERSRNVFAQFLHFAPRQTACSALRLASKATVPCPGSAPPDAHARAPAQTAGYPSSSMNGVHDAMADFKDGLSGDEPLLPISLTHTHKAPKGKAKHVQYLFGFETPFLEPLLKTLFCDSNDTHTQKSE